MIQNNSVNQILEDIWTAYNGKNKDIKGFFPL
ncbi:MAG: hypothetical protein [Caudoviricetes sp.]|nr:MAG: hypothetical protein [Caudoviricetes sp.]